MSALSKAMIFAAGRGEQSQRGLRDLLGAAQLVALAQADGHG